MITSQLLAELTPAVHELAQFGAAGFMGLMWLWERRTSQKREQQIDEAHARILSDQVQLDQLIAVVQQNVAAITRLTATQEQVVRRLETR